MKKHHYIIFWVLILILAIGMTYRHKHHHQAPIVAKAPAIDTTGDPLVNYDQL